MNITDYKEIQSCRVCGNGNLLSVLDLGSQPLSGIFLEHDDQKIPVTPLEIVKCSTNDDANACGLLQLRHSANIHNMYGTTYGYHSSLSPSMVRHLCDVRRTLGRFIELRSGDYVLDIGCNDGTLLNSIDGPNLKRVGIDPSSAKFRSGFDPDITLIYDYFSKETIIEKIGNKKFSLITAIAMFYDLEDPLLFFKDLNSLLTNEGVWAIELAYFPTMLNNLVYDQICHEHVLYPSLTDIEWLVDRSEMKILDVEFNQINGGSFLVIGSRNDSSLRPDRDKIDKILKDEVQIRKEAPIRKFKDRIMAHKDSVCSFFDQVGQTGGSVIGYGASTKGNIVLNYCGINCEMLPAICDSNPEKLGRRTPGSNIPIISKEKMRSLKPDYLFVLIWHFHTEILEDEAEFIQAGGKIVFSLPRLHVVDKTNYDHHLHSNYLDYVFPD